MNSFFNKLIFGLGLIAIGVLYLLGQLEILTFDIGYMFSTYWPAFIIFAGLKGLFSRQKHSGSGSFIWSVFVIFLGVYFLLNNLGIESFNYENMYKFIVPVLLILFGLNVLFKGSSANIAREEFKKEIRRERDAKKQEHREMREQLRYKHQMAKDQVLESYTPVSPLPPIDMPMPEIQPETAPNPNKQKEWKWNHHNHHNHHKYHQDGANRSSFIGDIHIGQDHWELTPLNISLFIGDTIIDLTNAVIPDGETSIHVSSFIGDLKIFIPSDLQVEVSVRASAFISDMKVLDRYESGLFKNMEAETRDYADGDKKLRITVSTFIGDVIVKRVG